MEGAAFYLIFWMFWVYLTFILPKDNPYRLRLAAAVLILIIFSNHHFSFGMVDVYANAVVILSYSYLFISKEKQRVIIYLLICSLIITIAYVTFHLFEIFDPVWLIFKKEWMMGIGIGYLAIILLNTLKGRLLIIFSGTMQGEILYTYILNKFQFPHSIGDFAYLDVCALISAVTVGWSLLENAGAVLQNHFHFLEKAKQKSS
ncbi:MULTISPECIES: YphA family membrane protein [Neobacillus]|uniref:Uncharacterized protein n=1 Tax=Neobacillus rhizophilus TaxID=2833579 RepID=A0A942UBE1_9BACI|nr:MULTISPECIES: hypothetical protein [Neobacillus]MBS4215846.1 hypothetical protein [Neobacillus rhizophilus]